MDFVPWLLLVSLAIHAWKNACPWCARCCLTWKSGRHHHSHAQVRILHAFATFSTHRQVWKPRWRYRALADTQASSFPQCDPHCGLMSRDPVCSHVRPRKPMFTEFARASSCALFLHTRFGFILDIVHHFAPPLQAHRSRCQHACHV